MKMSSSFIQPHAILDVYEFLQINTICTKRTSLWVHILQMNWLAECWSSKKHIQCENNMTPVDESMFFLEWNKECVYEKHKYYKLRIYFSTINHHFWWTAIVTFTRELSLHLTYCRWLLYVKLHIMLIFTSNTPLLILNVHKSLSDFFFSFFHLHFFLHTHNFASEDTDSFPGVVLMSVCAFRSTKILAPIHLHYILVHRNTCILFC